MTKLERKILRIPPIAFIISKSKVIHIPGFKGIPVYDIVKFFFQQIRKVGLNERASAISYNLIMALPAALLFLFSIVPYLPDSDKFKDQILGLFNDLSPNSASKKFIQQTIEGLLKKQVGVFSFGFLLLMFYASNATMGVIRTFDKSITENKKYFLHKRIRAIRLTIVLILLFLASGLALMGQHQLAILLKGLFHMKRRAEIPWWNGIRWVIIIALIFYGISFVYKLGPSVKKRWKLVSPGSILATTLTLSTTILFSFWVNNFASYNKVYGSIGTVLIIMLLIYLNSLILLIGFELNVSITYLQAEVEKRKLKE
ncbi:MAG: YihY/virulence factor BrkB family protein [Bacteroidetes bacterium]|nr:YihY/virulence factor BrkB family protein [Bacteroidota bacterium]MBS1650171.1 YihY/virulence factor BrkB family protein [Bacteroidota bacterium]